ncbi:phage holin family protein [Roseibium limicola]|uniref:Phage holin family protein n=1 Tax=Roseibium limicola TaxID=2816037 RepID=A0A939ES71_9HYPH|nr:phage holin family protein [Roseibium limicola]MBO0347340.1 phage holin family protein [Roseibium limicola]
MTTQQSDTSFSDRSIGTLFSRLLQEVSQLLRGEVQLAKQELKVQVLNLQTAALFFALAFILVFGGLLALLACAHFGLVAAGLPPVGAAAIIAATALVLAGLCGFIGARCLKSLSNPLRRTTHQTAEDTRLIKESLQ